MSLSNEKTLKKLSSQFIDAADVYCKWWLGGNNITHRLSGYCCVLRHGWVYKSRERALATLNPVPRLPCMEAMGRPGLLYKSKGGQTEH